MQTVLIIVMFWVKYSFWDHLIGRDIHDYFRFNIYYYISQLFLLIFSEKSASHKMSLKYKYTKLNMSTMTLSLVNEMHSRHMYHSHICTIWWKILTKSAHNLAGGATFEISRLTESTQTGFDWECFQLLRCYSQVCPIIQTSFRKYVVIKMLLRCSSNWETTGMVWFMKMF